MSVFTEVDALEQSLKDNSLLTLEEARGLGLSNVLTGLLKSRAISAINQDKVNQVAMGLLMERMLDPEISKEITLPTLLKVMSTLGASSSLSLETIGRVLPQNKQNFLINQNNYFSDEPSTQQSGATNDDKLKNLSGGDIQNLEKITFLLGNFQGSK